MINFITFFWVLYTSLIVSCIIIGYLYAKKSHELKKYFSNQYPKDLAQIEENIKAIEDLKSKIEIERQNLNQ